MYYTVKSKKKWVRSMGVWRKASVKKTKETKIQLALKLNRSLGELQPKTCTCYLPMRGPGTHILLLL